MTFDEVLQEQSEKGEIMKLTKEDIDFIECCLDYYLAKEKKFVSCYEFIETRKIIKKIINKISTIQKENEQSRGQIT